MSIFVEFKESQFTVKGSKMSTVLSTVGFLKPPPAASSVHHDCSCGGCGGLLKAVKAGVGRRPCQPYL